MSEQNETEEKVDRVSTDAPAEGAENPGKDASNTTPHAQAPAEGADPGANDQR